ncbi:hypothetical protein Si133o_00992 [Streptococcus infantarius subsp. infantarius]|nr:hypothetical protein [Streptococcus infantarius subsp. infantarius]
MNKQELIDKLKNDLTAMSEFKGIKHEYDKGYEWATKQHLVMITELDEPEKPVVPQFVADWYEENKDDFEYNVQCLCVHNCEPLREIDTWFDSDDTKPIETLVMMHKFGYEIEKEKLYTVEIPDPNGLREHALVKDIKGDIFIGHKCSNDWRKVDRYQLTESEIKKDFDWAFRWAKEVEE